MLGHDIGCPGVAQQMPHPWMVVTTMCAATHVLAHGLAVGNSLVIPRPGSGWCRSSVGAALQLYVCRKLAIHMHNTYQSPHRDENPVCVPVLCCTLGHGVLARKGGQQQNCTNKSLFTAV